MQARHLLLMSIVLSLATGLLLPSDQRASPPLRLEVIEELTNLQELHWLIKQPSLVRLLYQHIIDLPEDHGEFTTLCGGLAPHYTLTFFRDTAPLLRATIRAGCNAILNLDTGLHLVPDGEFWDLLNRAIGLRAGQRSQQEAHQPPRLPIAQPPPEFMIALHQMPTGT